MRWISEIEMPSALEHKPWRDLEDALVGVHGQLGVFALADAKDNTLFIGYAGGRTPFGLKGEITDQLQTTEGAVRARIEITTSYLSRYRECLMFYQAQFGCLPPLNPPERLGRLSPMV